MTREEIEELIMARNEKSAIASSTVWAGLASFFGGLIVAVPEIAETVAPILSPHSAGVLVAAAGVLSIFRRLFSANKDITSLLPK